MELKCFWVQDVVKEGGAKLKTVKGTENVSDHLTKPMCKAELEELLEKVAAEFESNSTVIGAGFSSKRRCSFETCIGVGRFWSEKHGRYLSVSVCRVHRK